MTAMIHKKRIRLGIRVKNIKIPFLDKARASKNPISAIGPRISPSVKGIGW